MADAKLTSQTSIGTLSSDDIFYVVDAPGGTPLSRKVATSVIAAYLGAGGMSTLFVNGQSLTSLDTDVTGVTGTPIIAAVANNATAHCCVLLANVANANGAVLNLMKTRAASGSTNANTIVSASDVLGQIDFHGADGADYKVAARIRTIVDGTPGAGDMPGTLEFLVTADGASTPTSRVRFSQAGNVLVGTTTAPTGTATKAIVFGDNAGNPTPGTDTAAIFAKDVAGTVEVFVIDEAGNATQISSHGPLDEAEAAGVKFEADDMAPWVNHTFNIYTGVEVWRYTGPSGATQIVQVQKKPTSDWDTVQKEMWGRHIAVQAAWDRHEKEYQADLKLWQAHEAAYQEALRLWLTLPPDVRRHTVEPLPWHGKMTLPEHGERPADYKIKDKPRWR